MIGNIGYVDVFGETRTAPFFWRLYWSTLECPVPGTNKYGGGYNATKVIGGPGEYWHGFRGRVHKLSMKPASQTPKPRGT